MSAGPAPGFALDPRLAADTAYIADWTLCRVLLMDDARFPWLILVPRRAGLADLDELPHADRATLMDELSGAMHALRTVARCDKLNVGALGNVVRQLHVHVVARRIGDDAWPGPVWSHGAARRYAPEIRARIVRDLIAAAATVPGLDPP